MLLKSLFVLTIVAIALAQADPINEDEFAADALFAHNLYRKIHGVPVITLNPRLNEIARRRSQELANASQLNVKQNLFDGQNLGETVGSVGGFTTYNGISATQLWYSVVSKFDEEGESSNEGASFTQIVWKSTREVGFGITKSKDGKFFFVAEYFPSGNIRGQYERNVFQLSDEELSKSCIVKATTNIATATEAVLPTVHAVDADAAAATAAVHDTHVVKKTDKKLLKIVKSGKKIAAATATTTISTTVEPEIISTTTPFVAEEITVATTAAAEIIAAAETTTTVLPVEETTIAFEPVEESTTVAPIRMQQIIKVTKKPIVAETTTTFVDSTLLQEELTTVRPVTHNAVKIQTTTALPVFEETTAEITTIAVPTFEESTITTTTVLPVVEETTTVAEEITTVLPIETTAAAVEEILTTTEALPVEESTATIALPTTRLQAIVKKNHAAIITTTTTTTTVASDLSREESNIDVKEPETTVAADVVEETTVVAPIMIKSKVAKPIVAVTTEATITEEAITEATEPAATEEIVAVEATTLKPTVGQKLIAKLKNKSTKVLLEQPVVQKSEPVGKFSFTKSE